MDDLRAGKKLWTNEPAGFTTGWPVWGHDAAVEDLSLAIGAGYVAHAYLITGPESIGKRALATAFAQALCCQDSIRRSEGQRCGACLSCRKISRGTHPDVQQFGLAQQAALSDKTGGQTGLTIDTVRRVCGATALRPMEGRWRVLVIDNAETMQGVAQEALLKTLEEPPASVVILLLAEEAETLLPTVRSRCQIVDLRPVPRQVVARALEARGIERSRADEIASLAGGRPGWALRAVGDAAVVDERRRAVDWALEWMEGSPYDRLVAAVRLGDTFQKRRVKVFDDLDILLGLWRDALLLRVAVPGCLTFREYAERLQGLAEGWELPALRGAIQAVQTCVADLDANVRPRLAIEAMVLQWPTPSK